MNRIKLQRQLTALLLATVATISLGSVGAQDEVQQGTISDKDFIEAYTEDAFETEKPATSNEAEVPALRGVVFDDFSTVVPGELTFEFELTPPGVDEDSSFSEVVVDNELQYVEESFALQAKESTPPINTTEFVENVTYDANGFTILEQGQTYELKTRREFQKFQTSDSEILKAENNSMQKIFVTGNSLGNADLYIYYTDGSSEGYNFRVKSNSNEFESIIKQLFPNHKLEIVPIKDSAVFLRGTVETAAEVEQIEEIAGEFWPTVHNHVEAKQPEIQTEFQPAGLNASVQIPKEMRVITIPIMEWEQNPNGPNFNKVVSLFTSQKISKEGEEPVRYSSDEKLIGHNIEIFSGPRHREQDYFLLSLRVTIDQFNSIRRATENNLQFIAISQIIHRQAEPPTKLLPRSDFVPSGRNSLLNQPEKSPVPTDIDLKIEPQLNPQLSPLSPVIEFPVPNEDLEALPLPNPGPGVTKPKTDSTELLEDRILPGTTFDAAPTIRSDSSEFPQPAGADLPASPIGLPGPAHIPMGSPAGLRPQSNSSPNIPFPAGESKSASSLQDDVRALHSDVKNLIALLEKRQAKKVKQTAVDLSKEIVPLNGKAVLFFHADWGGPSQKMKPIVKKLHEDGIGIVSVDIDEHPEIMKRYKVENIPTFLHIEDSHPCADSKKTGVMTEEELRRYVRISAPTSPLVERLSSQSDLSIKNLVRISIGDPSTTNRDALNSSPADNLGTGLVIHHSGKKLCALTAAHLFSKSHKDREVTVKFFHRRDGIYEPHYCKGKLLSSDEDADLALVEFEIPNITYMHKPTLLSAKRLEVGDEVRFVGFATTDQYSRSQLTGKVASIDRFAGPANFQIEDVIPTQGMSGSPVFDEDECLCGIVFAADASEKQTVCTGLKEIKKLLKEAKIDLPERDNESQSQTRSGTALY